MSHINLSIAQELRKLLEESACDHDEGKDVDIYGRRDITQKE